MTPAEVPFFLLAGGLGTRARPLSDYKPKPLFPLAGRPLLEIMLSQLGELGLRRGFVNLHHLGEEVRRVASHREGIQFFYEEKLSGSMILKEAAPRIDELLLVVNGDIFTRIPIQRMLSRLRTDDADGVLLIRRTTDPHYPELILEDSSFLGRAKDLPRMSESRRQDNMNYMYTGVALFNKRILEAIDQISFFDSLARGRFAVSVVESVDPWWDLGTPYLYFQADAAYRRYMGFAENNSFSPGGRVGDNCVIDGSIIWENTEIGGQSVISRCIVVGNMSLRDVNYHDKIVTPDGVYDLPERS